MIQLSHLDHIVLRVIDLDAMTRFNCAVLGCSIERRQDDIGLLQLRAGRCLIDLVPVDGKLGRMGGAAPGAQGRNLDHFCFRVEHFDADAIRAHLAGYGVAAGALETRYGAEGQGPSIYLRDVEGNAVELKGAPAEPVSPGSTCLPASLSETTTTEPAAAAAAGFAEYVRLGQAQCVRR